MRAIRNATSAIFVFTGHIHVAPTRAGGNDDAARSIKLFTGLIADTIAQGKAVYDSVANADSLEKVEAAMLARNTEIFNIDTSDQEGTTSDTEETSDSNSDDVAAAEGDLKHANS